MEVTEQKTMPNYWDGKAKLYPTYIKFFKALVPQNGEAPTQDGESIRAIGKLTYDYCNNGNCNALEVETESCSECGGCGYEEEEACNHCGGSGKDEDGDDCIDCDGSGSEEQQDCYVCGGECNVESERTIRSDFEDLLMHVETYVPNSKKAVQKVRDVITKREGCTFKGDEMNAYTEMSNIIVEHVMKNQDNFDKKVKDGDKVEYAKAEKVLKKGYRFTTEQEVKVLNFLNRLRDSGKTNMLGATPYLISEFGFDKREARGFLTLWMDNFNEEGKYSQVKEVL